jgi:probable phosphoglycerate mutase
MAGNARPRSMAEPLLYYVRHGETEWNVQGRLQGQHDSPLTERGCAQAVECGEILHDLIARDGHDAADFDYVASPLGRARTTMERVRATLGLVPAAYRTDARLAELSFGRWEGLAYPQLQATEQEVLAARERDKWGFKPPGGESYADLLVRVRAWHATLTRNSIVVAHGGTARALVALYGIAPPEAASATDIQHGVVYWFSVGGLARYG